MERRERAGEECRHGNMSRTVCGDGLKITARRVRTGLEISDDSRSCRTECRARSSTRSWAGLFLPCSRLSTATGSALNGGEERVRA